MRVLYTILLYSSSTSIVVHTHDTACRDMIETANIRVYPVWYPVFYDVDYID